MVDYLATFPVPQGLLPSKLIELLTPVSREEPEQLVLVTEHYERGGYTKNREYCHMLMASIPEDESENLKVADFESSSHGVVSFSTPECREKGGLSTFIPSLSGYDYIVSSWGTGSFYTSHLSDKVWMALGLSQRCIGNSEQKIVFDDLALPILGVAEGDIGREYYFEPTKNMLWRMRNDYLRKYLWMRGQCGVRVFYYEACLERTGELKALLESAANEEGADGWFKHTSLEWCNVTIQPQRALNTYLLQVWAVVVAVSPERCAEVDIETFTWPGDSEPMTRRRASAVLHRGYDYLYLRDDFLQKFELDSVYRVSPLHGCISYKGQWDMGNCQRVGRDLVQVEVKKLYEGAPRHIIETLYPFAVTPPADIPALRGETHIAQRANLFIQAVFGLGTALARLGAAVGLPQPPTAEAYIGLDKAHIDNVGWWTIPNLAKLGHSASRRMPEQVFLARCKSMAEVLTSFKDGYLRNIVIQAGILQNEADIKSLKNLKLLQCILIFASGLVRRAEKVDMWPNAAASFDWKERSPDWTAVMVLNDLRQADAHEKIGECFTLLETLGLDTARLTEGYGEVLDFIYDHVTLCLNRLTTQINNVLE